MKYFVCSDTHAHHTEMLNGLNEAGFDPRNENHFLIVVGDITDRGQEALAHILYLKDIVEKGRGVVLRGNHDSFITGFLKNRDQSFNWMHNGLNTTIDDLVHETRSFEMYCIFTNKEMNTTTFGEWQRINASKIKKEFPWLLDWFLNLPDYYETKHYAFTHGIVNQNIDDWRKSDWSDCHWARPEDYINFHNPTGKHLVVGHLNASLMKWTREHHTANGYDVFDFEPDNEIYYDPDIDTYFLDSCTILSKHVNVLVFEDDPIE